VALSYAFLSREHDAEVIAEASRMSLKVIEGLVKKWDESVQVFSVNVPLVKGVEKTKILWTQMLQNRWKSGSCFTEVDVPAKDDDGPNEEEARIRRGEGGSPASIDTHIRYTHKHFKWTPKFTDVYESVEKAPPGNDGWAVKEGFVRYVCHKTEPS
jgi:broad specificity polyphosphatase/5'/3'-nucleotidase SurE